MPYLDPPTLYYPQIKSTTNNTKVLARILELYIASLENAIYPDVNDPKYKET